MIPQTFAALSDPTRLRILRLLADGELCVGDLVDILRVPQPKASRHLACLRRAGLVRAREDRWWVYYSLAHARNPFHRKLLDCLRTIELRSDSRRAARVRKSGGCCP